MDILGIILAILVFTFGLEWIKENRPYLIGRAGEKFVSKQLNKLGPKYIVLDNLLLPHSGRTKTTQIDHVVISNYGIFCIETKDFKGIIEGNANEKFWTHEFSYLKKEFLNPIWQNYAHIKAIENLIEPSHKIKIRSFIVFPKAGRLNVFGTNQIGTAADIVKRIKSFEVIVLSESDRDAIIKLLKEANITSRKLRRQHIEQVRKLISKNRPQ